VIVEVFRRTIIKDRLHFGVVGQNSASDALNRRKATHRSETLTITLTQVPNPNRNPMSRHNVLVGRPVDRGDRGKVFPGPATFSGAQPSLKNTENGFPGGFFLTSNMHKIHFWPLGELTTLPRPLLGW